jgi:peptidylprolyl isomerase domain and WD repeat-containing protein 1
MEEGSTTPRSNKRSRSEVEEEEKCGESTAVDDQSDGNSNTPIAMDRQYADSVIDTSSNDDIGPQLPSSAPKKKRRILPYEKLYIDALPKSVRYSKSLMHKEQLLFVTVTPFTDFLITSSMDGIVKFWKKVAVGIEFVKEFRAHVGEIKSVSVSSDGRSFASAGADSSVKIFDVITFGMLE